MSETSPEASKGSSIMKIITSNRFSGLVGIIGPLVAVVGITIAILLSVPWFNWFSSALSDLGHPFMFGGSNGVPGDNSLVAIIFNTSLICTGIITLPLSIRLILLHRQPPSLLGIGGGILLMIAQFFLISIGIFSEVFGELHFYVSVGFFLSILLFGLIYGALLMLNAQTRIMGIWAFILSLISAIIWVVHLTVPGVLPWTGAAIPEVISAGVTMAWIFPLCIRLYVSGD